MLLSLASLVVTDQAAYPQVGQAPKEDVEGQEEIDVEGGDEQQIKYSPKTSTRHAASIKMVLIAVR